MSYKIRKFKNHEKVYHLKEKRFLEAYNYPLIGDFLKGEELRYILIERTLVPGTGPDSPLNFFRQFTMTKVNDVDHVISMVEYRKFKIEGLIEE